MTNGNIKGSVGLSLPTKYHGYQDWAKLSYLHCIQSDFQNLAVIIIIFFAFKKIILFLFI